MSWSNAFKPNSMVHPTVFKVLVGGWIVTTLLAWQYQPFEVLPKPMAVLEAFPRLLSERGLLPNIGISLWTNIQALFISSAIALGLAYLSVLPIIKPAAIFLGAIRFCGFAGVTVFFTLMFHSDHGIKVALLVFGMVGFYVLGMYDTVRNIPSERYDYARTLGMGEWRAVWDVVVRGTRAEAWDAFRLNSAMGWILLSTLEGTYRSEGGVGVMLVNQIRHMDYAAMCGVQLAILITGGIWDALVYGAKQLTCAYAFRGGRRNAQ